MKLFKNIGTTGVVSMSALALAACGQSGKSTSSSGSKEAKKLASQVPVKAIKDGGTVTVAELTDTPFTGIFNEELNTSAIDADLMSPASEGLFDTNESYKINNKGPATFKLDKKAKTITIQIKKGVKWSDGKQVNAKDIEYAYEIVANKGTASQNYTGSLANIVGLAEYHSGKTNTISGIDMPDGENGLKVVIHFKQMKPGMYQSGNGYFLENAAPYHYLKDVPFSKLMSSDKIRKTPMFFGPYKISKLVRGQSVTWVPNKYYWRGKPHLDKITYTVLTPNSSAQAIKSKKFNEVSVVNSQWNQVKNSKNYNFIAAVPLSYRYLALR